MEVIERQAIGIKLPSDVGHLRRLATALARSAGFAEVDEGRVAIGATEAATNLLKHADGGEVLLRQIEERGERGVDLIVLDTGPGITEVPAAMRDGFSTSGTPGSGLGSIARQASFFDLYSGPGVGTVLFARFWANRRAPSEQEQLIGGVCVAHPGEEQCGDGWAFVHESGRTTVLVVDGLGHGKGAAEAAERATSVFLSQASGTPVEIMRALHDALRPTRGAAASVARIDRGRHELAFVGIGNVAATVLANGATRSAVSHHGTLGHDVRKFQEFQYPWPPGAVLVLHSDGLMSRWTIDRYPGLRQRHPTIIAAVLYRDARRGRDDATAVVVRDAA